MRPSGNNGGGGALVRPEMTRTADSPTESAHLDGVLVVGGGYAGLHAAQAARRDGVPVTVVDATGRHDFVTRLAAVAGGTAAVTDASQPLASFVDRVEVALVRDVGDGSVTLTDGRRLRADAVVVTAGSVSSRPPVEGIEHARTLRSAEDALALRDELAEAASVVIVGGGATGVQLAGAAAHAHPGLDVTVVELAPRLLANLPAPFGAGARRILTDRGVHLHLGHGVERITPSGAVVDGVLLPGLTVWAGGFEADASGYGLPASPEGRVLVDDTLRVLGCDRTFAAGDLADHRDGQGRSLPMSAQVAVQAGTVAGGNAARLVRGSAPVAARFRQLGWVFDLGGRRGLAQVGPLDLTLPGLDLVPPLLHDAIDVKNLVEIGGLAALRFAPSSLLGLLRRGAAPCPHDRRSAAPLPAAA